MTQRQPWAKAPNDRTAGGAGPDDLVEQAIDVVSERRLARWKKTHGGQDGEARRWRYVMLAGAAGFAVLMFLVAAWNLAAVLSIAAFVAAFVAVRLLFERSMEDNLILLLQRQAQIFGYEPALTSRVSMPLVIRQNLHLLSGFESADFQIGAQGRWRGVEIALAELYVRPEYDDDDYVVEEASWGLVVCLAKDHALSSPLRITKDRGAVVNRALGWLRRNRVPIDHAEFEKRYQVYCDDSGGASELLNAGFARQILDLPRPFGVAPAALLLTDGVMMAGYWSEADILTGFSLEMATTHDIRQFARRNALPLSLPHRIIEHLELKPATAAFPVRSKIEAGAGAPALKGRCQSKNA